MISLYHNGFNDLSNASVGAHPPPALMYSPQIQHVGVRLASLPFLVRGALPLTVFTQSGPDPLYFNFQVLVHDRPTAKAHHWMNFFPSMNLQLDLLAFLWP